MAPSGRERAQIRLDYKRLHRAADSRVPKLKAIIASALNAAYNSVSDLDAADAYSQSPESFRRAIDWRTVGRILGAPDSDYTVYKAATAADVFGEIFIDGGKTASGYLSGSLAMTEPLAIAYGEQRAGTLIQGIQTQQLNTVRAAIGTGLSEGVPPQRTGRLLRATTGLSERQGRSLVNYERGLTEKMLTGTTGTVLRGAGRPLADQRYSLANLNQQKVDNLVERYRERLVNYRAEMIARTETMRAANMGAFAEQRAQASAGLFDAKTAQRVWQTTPDDRACDECTDLDGQIVGFEQSFVLSADAESNTTGENMSGEVPPLHPMCRCTFYLDVSLESLANAFRDGNFDFGADTRSLDDLLGPRWQEGFKPGAQMQLPTLPQLNYLPPTVPSARGAATIEEAATTPRARRPRTVKPKPEPVEVPAVIEPTPAVTIEPQATTTATKPLDLQQGFKFGDDLARERFSGPLDEMAKIHGLSPEMPTLLQDVAKPFETQVRLSEELKGLGHARGVFRPAGTGQTAPEIEVKIANWSTSVGSPRGDEISTFMHEVGHRVDAMYDVASGYHSAWYSESGTPATIDFLKAATTDSPSFAQGLEHYAAQGQGEYFGSAIEVWARAYNQWMAYELEATVPKVAEQFASQGRSFSKLYQWNEAEFRANIGPKVRAVLEERGLIVVAQESALVDAAAVAEAAATEARMLAYNEAKIAAEEAKAQAAALRQAERRAAREAAKETERAAQATGDAQTASTNTSGKRIDLQEGFQFGNEAGREAFGSTLDEIAKIHGLSPDLPSTRGKSLKTSIERLADLKKGTKAKGVFRSAGNGGVSPAIEVKISSSKVVNAFADEVSTFMHEVGHRVDAIYTESGYFKGFYSNQGTPATVDFLKAATTDSPSFAQGLEYYTANGKGKYFESATEVWARAYNQYIAYEVEATAPEVSELFAVKEKIEGLKNYQWSEAEFRANIAPKVRAVLQERGLL